ncbi:hypothetical protein C0Q70_02890 [Pomacea canaliculata]|uniref:Cubilin n=1 Tax=Pomacea canaliculata TaxID=400727 RepID=A0A2T7PR68_POMCA|nr:hypothetical protein C0Q70_02890 [Pomacea canaliculata]
MESSDSRQYECPDNTYGTNCTNECTCNRQNTQSCNKTTGVCTCKGGWTGSTCDTDVDECTAGSVTCPGNSVCINLPGTYLCSCYSGFFKSNQTCLECAEGFYGASCTSACSCSVNTVSCNKTTGSCTCKAGWTGTRCDTDVNECALGVNSCTGSHVVCVNVDGGYRCDCSSGYTYNTSASTCSDTDECSNNLDDCLQVCTNTDGSYTCSCASDYWGTGNDCTELTKVPATLVVDIPIPASELANPYSVKYEGWKQMTAGAVEELSHAPSHIRVFQVQLMSNIRAGSLIVECQFVLDDHTYLTAVSDLISSLADLAFTSITIGNYSGNVVITVKGTSASSSSLCTVYDLVSQCPSGEQCQVEDSKPVCKPSPKDDECEIVLRPSSIGILSHVFTHEVQRQMPEPEKTSVSTDGANYINGINASAGFGFQARVSKVPKCGSTDIRLHENSPFQMYYSQNEPVHGRCEWTLTAEQGLAIVMIGYISYNDINVNQQFKMYRGRTKDNSSLITISKSRYNEIAIDEASNIILIEYIANETSYFYVYVTFMAYNRTQNSTCGSATYNSSVEGVINLYTDGLSNINGYYRNGICTWTIEAQEGEVIQLEVTYFYIQSATPGCNDSARSYLEVYDGSQTEDRLLVRACSFDPLVPVTSKTRRLVVVLTLDEEFGFTRASFTARYKSFNNSAILRDCGGDIYGDEGVVSSPNYPANYDNLRDCEWRITVEDSFNIRVDIHDLDIRPYNYGYYCAGDSLLFTGAYPFGYSTGLYYRVCGTYYGYYRGPPIYSTNNSLTMRFVSDWENTGRGFNASWRKACDMILQTSNGWIKSPRFPTGYPNNLNCSYILQTPNNQPGYFITFTFNSFDLQEPDSKGSCIYDYLELVQVPSYNPGYFITPNAKVFCGRGPTQSLTTYFPTTIHFVTDGSITKGGFNISFIQTMAGCGESLYMGEKGFVTSPNYPGTFPRLINCTTTIRVEPGHNITLTFQSFFLGNYLANVNGSNCWWRAGGVLEVYDRISSQSVLTGTYCGYSSPQPITSTSNELTLVFRCTYNDYATGFNATYISTLALTAFRDCGGQLNGTNGEIISPRYPDLYPANAVCEWIITGDTGDRVRLSFVDFHLQDTISCQLDSLEMRDGSSVYSPRLDRVCGDAIPQEVTSTGNIMLVRFVTDGEMTYRGFKASWTSVCEETYRTTEGIIQSPSYPNSYPRRKQCTYFIEQREGYVFELTFTNFSLGDVRGSCSKNYVEVRDGGFDTSPLLGSRYCGGDLPPVLTSSQSLMWIRKSGIGRYGMQIYELGDRYSADQVCQDWYDRNLPLDVERQKNFQRLPQCPCHWNFLWGNWIWSHYIHDYTVICYRMILGRSRSVSPHGQSHHTSDRSAATGGDGTGGTGGTGPPTVSSSPTLLMLVRPRPSTLSSGHYALTTSEKTGRPMTFAATTLRHQSTVRCTTSSDLYEHAPRGCRSASVRNLLLPYRCL